MGVKGKEDRVYVHLKQVGCCFWGFRLSMKWNEPKELAIWERRIIYRKISYFKVVEKVLIRMSHDMCFCWNKLFNDSSCTVTRWKRLPLLSTCLFKILHCTFPIPFSISKRWKPEKINSSLSIINRVLFRFFRWGSTKTSWVWLIASKFSNYFLNGYFSRAFGHTINVVLEE